MPLPDAASKTNLDQGSDDPKQARGQLATLIDLYNDLRTYLGTLTYIANGMALGDGLEANGTTDFRVKIEANKGIGRSSNGLAVDINGMTDKGAPEAADSVAIYDAAGAAPKKSTLANFFKAIAGLTEDTSPVPADDFVLTYDASATAAKKVKLSNLAAGSCTATVFTASGTWTKPAGLKFVKVTVMAGGGGGGGTTSAATVGAGPGAGGGMAVKWIAAGSLASTVAVTVGAAGTAGSGLSAGGNGGNSAFGAHCSSTGGTGGGASGGGAGTAGTATGGDLNVVGGQPLAGLNNGASPGGAGPFGNGPAYGGGGHGAPAFGGTGTGAGGGAGVVIVEEYF